MIRVYSHPRSGTNFVAATIAAAFYPDEDLDRHGDIKTGHWAERRSVPAAPGWRLQGRHGFWNDHRACFYLVRDGRSVAASMWRTKEFQHPKWRGLSFSEFLRKPLDWHVTPGNRKSRGLTIVEHWYKHTESWADRPNVCYVRYEEMLADPEAVLGKIGQFLDREPAPYEPVGIVGPFPRESDWVLDDWQNVFGDDDLEYFFSIVPKDWWALWNESPFALPDGEIPIPDIGNP